MKRTIVLAILDGWGIGENNDTNPLHTSPPKNINNIKHNYLSGALQASGISVGLPWGEEGNSEVGHLTIGSGKVVYQHLPKITLSIRDGSFFKNETLLQAAEHVKKNSSSLNLAGLITEGGVHASFEHLESLAQFASEQGIQKLNFHFFSDGKDGPIKFIHEQLKKIEILSKKYGIGTLSSLSGRYYAMNRDGHWELTRQTYNAIIGKSQPKEIESVIQESYEKNLSDEFFRPSFLTGGIPIQDGDALFFFNFREDSMRQISEAFANPEFDKFETEKFKNLFIATMTQYFEKDFGILTAFPPDRVTKPLGKVLADNDKTQVRIAETEKYAHVTFFFNGYRDTPFKNEYNILVPSQNIARHDEHPEMRAAEITERAVQSINENAFDFIVINYANPDIIAHTGNFESAEKAISVVDEQIENLKNAVLQQNGVLIITSDHGNVEKMRDPLTGVPETKHDPNPVPIYIIGKEFERQKDDDMVRKSETEVAGILADVAPTILKLMQIPIPKEMTGQSLFPFLS